MNVEAPRVEALPEPVPLSEIEVPADRLRDIDPDKVREMVISLRENGQLQPIQVLPRNPVTGKYVLNIGLHRFSAAPDAGLPKLRAELFHGTADQARLAEIDENLYRAELNPLDQGAFVAERRAVYERIYGIVSGGRPKKKTGTNLSQLSFFDDTTARFGLSRKTVQRALARFNGLDPVVRRLLRGTRTARIASEIDALTRLVPFEQLEVAKLLAGPTPPKNVVAAWAKVRGVEARKLHIVRTATDRMIAIWTKAPNEDRRAFIEYLQREHPIGGIRAALKKVDVAKGKR